VRAAARLAAEHKIVQPTRVLDLCAGLGTKSIQLARAFKEATVTATDVDADKLARLVTRARQVKQGNVQTVALGELGPTTTFDLVLVDAPCSNTGVFSKRVQSRWRWPILDHSALAELQMKLMKQGASLVTPGGSLIYATCSIDPAENGKRVAAFLEAMPGWKMVHEEATLPSLDAASPGDGGYFAVLVR
jgi:16S rRNA (cytosine967-C5)-methyltransferase